MTAVICLGQSFSNKKRFTSLKLRVEKSVKLYKEGRGSKLIFTGGFTVTADISEAQLMSDIARAMGVPHDTIILEEKATTTVGNAVYSKKILEGNNLESAIVVTSPAHIRRARYVFRKIMPDKHLEFVSSDKHYGLLKMAPRHFVETLKLGQNSILLSLEARKTNINED